MRILHLISQRPDSTGSGIYVQEMLRAAVDEGHDNHLLAGIQSEQMPEIDLLPSSQCTYVEFNSSSLPFNIVGMSDVMPYASTRFRDLNSDEIRHYEQAFGNALCQVIDRFAPDIIHSHHLWLVTSLAARMFPHIPLVTTCHGTDLRQLRNCPHLRPRVMSGCRNIDHILALSPAQREEIQREYRFDTKKISVAGGGFNKDLFFQENKPALSAVRLLYAGKLSKAKGVPWLLKALSSLEQDNIHLDLIGSGSGTDFEECVKLAEQLGDKVTLHGQLSQSQLAALMRKAHIMVLPSFFEGLPLIMLEAIVSGCRVIATDLPGTNYIASILESDHITLVALPTDAGHDCVSPEKESDFVADLARALTESITQTRKEPEVHLHPLASKIDHFSWKAVYERTHQAYSLLL